MEIKTNLVVEKSSHGDKPIPFDYAKLNLNRFYGSITEIKKIK